MTALAIITPGTNDWDDFVARHPQGHILQTPAWGELKSQFGWMSALVALAGDNHTVVAGTQVLFRRLPMRLGTLAYIPKGPLVPQDWWQDADRMTPLWQAVHAIARHHDARWLKVEAPDPAPEGVTAQTMVNALAANGFQPSLQNIQPVRTITLDISASEDTILQRMKQKTRYNIRLGPKKDVVVRQGTVDDVASFNAMMAVTGSRDDFGVHAPAYYRRAYELFAPAGRAALFIATYREQDLAGVMVFALGKTAWYFYGASTNEERQRMPTYAAQWEAIRWARAQGCTQYDLWGVPDAGENELEASFMNRHDDLWGVYRFKRGWGGDLVRRVPAWDYIYNRPVYALYQWYLRRTRQA